MTNQDIEKIFDNLGLITTVNINGALVAILKQCLIYRSINDTEWIAYGPVHETVSEVMYNTPLGRADIRFNGMSQGISPLKQSTPVIDGREVMTLSTQNQLKSTIFGKKLFDTPTFTQKYILLDHDDTSKINRYVFFHHIDTELGLQLFINTIKNLC